ncbi:MAG TPA: MarR family transcriptional regulator [Candidatus Pullichristensenella avicola]|nr:MarR family transcriptional regulator [Candidatus Pullichristensenella avicola]
MDPFLATLNEMFTTTYRSVLKVEEVMLRHLSNNSLTISEMHMLESVGRHGGEAAITDIAQDLEITPPSVTMAVKRLEKKGYITKDRSSQDGRRVRVRLTGDGRRAETAHRYFHRQMVRAVAGDLSQAEKDALLSGLQKMNEFMRQKAEEYAGARRENA